MGTSKTEIININVATSVRYGNYKQYRYIAEYYSSLIERYYPLIKEHIDLPKDNRLFFHLRPVRGCYGRAFIDRECKKMNSIKKYIVELDIRQSEMDFKNTLIHELVHIEQYYQNRLDMHSGSGYSKWEGKRVKDYPAHDARYFDLPWEAEASTRANNLMYLYE